MKEIPQPNSALLENFDDEMKKIHVEIINFFKNKKDPLDAEIVEFGKSIGLNNIEIYRHIAKILGDIVSKEQYNKVVHELLQINPMELKKLPPLLKDREMLRLAIIAELDAVTLYEQMAENASDETVKEVFKDVAYEEKVHVEEFTQVMEKVSEDDELEKAVKQAEDEVDKMM